MLTRAFTVDPPDFALAHAGFEQLRSVAAFAQDVKESGYSTVLLDEAGRLRYQLSAEDQEAVHEFMNEHVFVIIDLMTIVSIEAHAFPHFLADDERSPGLLHRIVSELRGPYYEIMALEHTWTWGVPLFGSLALLAKQLRASQNFPFDSYRDLLWAGREAQDSLEHLQVIAEPLSSSEYDRRQAYRRACAHLSTADTRAAVEMAERHMKAFPVSSFLQFLQPAAEWPVFDLLRRKAVLADTGNLADVPAAFLAGSAAISDSLPASVGETAMKAGTQRMSPTAVLETYRMLHVVGALCDALDVQWWMSHGSLIGALRDGGLSRHADDCEIDVLNGRNLENFQGPAMRRALARNGYELSYDPRGKVFKVWPAGSARALADEDQLTDQTWWLPQQRVGSPSLDVYVLDHTPNGAGEQAYVSNEDFHCNHKVCTQLWFSWELDTFRRVSFGDSQVWVPVGAESYLERVYGADWNTTVRAHRWASDHQEGHGFAATAVDGLAKRTAEPFGPLLAPVLPAAEAAI